MMPLTNPTPAQIREARESAGLSQTAAAQLIHSSRSSWAQWEAKEGGPTHRAMHPAMWELFLIKTSQHERFNQPG